MTTSEPIRIRRGQFVRTWFDTGALGATIIYGEVIAAGTRTYSVRWESGIVNRIRQGQAGVERVPLAELVDLGLAVNQ